jgi:hypothetical protein
MGAGGYKTQRMRTRDSLCPQLGVGVRWGRDTPELLRLDLWVGIDKGFNSWCNSFVD